MTNLANKVIKVDHYDIVVMKRHYIKALQQLNKGDLNIYDNLHIIDRAEFDERAGILEYYNNWDRRTATKQALIELFDIYSKKVKKED